MEIYQTEEQQVEAIKSYWQKNGNTLIAGAAIGLAAFIGFNFYQESKLEKELLISDSYQTLIKQSTTDQAAFIVNAKEFIEKNGDSSYASLTALVMAKESATAKDWPQVQKELSTAIATAPSEGIKAIASIRLARVQVQLEQYTEALATLNTPLPTSFSSAVEEIKGDIYLQQDKKDLAHTAYQAAITANGLTNSSLLQMKLDDLAQTNSLPNIESKSVDLTENPAK